MGECICGPYRVEVDCPTCGQCLSARGEANPTPAPYRPFPDCYQCSHMPDGRLCDNCSRLSLFYEMGRAQGRRDERERIDGIVQAAAEAGPTSGPSARMWTEATIWIARRIDEHVEGSHDEE